jgi:hypothetical protein
METINMLAGLVDWAAYGVWVWLVLGTWLACTFKESGVWAWVDNPSFGALFRWTGWATIGALLVIGAPLAVLLWQWGFERWTFWPERSPNGLPFLWWVVQGAAKLWAFLCLCALPLFVIERVAWWLVGAWVAGLHDDLKERAQHEINEHAEKVGAVPIEAKHALLRVLNRGTVQQIVQAVENRNQRIADRLAQEAEAQERARAAEQAAEPEPPLGWQFRPEPVGGH